MTKFSKIILPSRAKFNADFKSVLTFSYIIYFSRYGYLNTQSHCRFIYLRRFGPNEAVVSIYFTV